MNKHATLVIDLQHEYLPTGKLPLVGLDSALTNAARIIAAARAKGELLIHVRHESIQSDAPFFTPDTVGIKIIPAVMPENNELVIVKNYPNSFRDTKLKELLDAQSIKEVLIIGAMSHMCIEATSRAAADFGYSVTVAHDACATMNLEFEGISISAAQVHATSMAALGFGYALITTTDKYFA